MSIKRRGSPESHRKLGNLVQRVCVQPPAGGAHITVTAKQDNSICHILITSCDHKGQKGVSFQFLISTIIGVTPQALNCFLLMLVSVLLWCLIYVIAGHKFVIV